MAACLAYITLPVYLVSGRAYVAASLLLTGALVVLYLGLHQVVSRYLTGVNRWLVAGLVVLPVVLVWLFGQGGGPLFGQGEGGTAALTYLTASFFIDFLRGRAGCEVLAVPSLIFGTRTNVPCVLLCPIDHAEAHLPRE